MSSIQQLGFSSESQYDVIWYAGEEVDTSKFETEMLYLSEVTALCQGYGITADLYTMAYVAKVGHVESDGSYRLQATPS